MIVLKTVIIYHLSEILRDPPMGSAGSPHPAWVLCAKMVIWSLPVMNMGYVLYGFTRSRFGSSHFWLLGFGWWVFKFVLVFYDKCIFLFPALPPLSLQMAWAFTAARPFVGLIDFLTFGRIKAARVAPSFSSRTAELSRPGLLSLLFVRNNCGSRCS